MKFRQLKKKNKAQAHNLLKYFFPGLSLLAIWGVSKKSKFFEVNKKKKFLGVAVFSVFAFLGKNFMFLEFLAVNPAKRGGGIGTLMLMRIERHARKKGRHFVFLFSAPWRTKAHRFYQKHGYHKVLGFVFWKKLMIDK